MPSLDPGLPFSLFLRTIVRCLWDLMGASVLLKCIKLLEQKSMRIFLSLLDGFVEDGQTLLHLRGLRSGMTTRLAVLFYFKGSVKTGLFLPTPELQH